MSRLTVNFAKDFVHELFLLSFTDAKVLTKSHNDV